MFYRSRSDDLVRLYSDIDNRTAYAHAPMILFDEQARPLLVMVLRATYAVTGGGVALVEPQPPVSLVGELHGDDPATASYRFEPEVAFVKPATDVVLLGHAYAPRSGAVESEVRFRVGPVAKTVHVVGDRVWRSVAGEAVISRPQPIEAVPLIYERAFGGVDRGAGSSERPVFDARNPVGRGFQAPHGRIEDGCPLPNLEDPAHRLHTPGQVVPVAGFGFISPGWQPRAGLAGTYDAAWTRERMPLLPRDFDRRFFNAAASGLVAPGTLHGDEAVVVTGAGPTGSLAFRLPGPPPPSCRVSLRRRRDALVEPVLDTVVVDVDARRVHLTWRGHVVLRDGAHDVRAIVIDAPAPARRVAAR